jgi:hypothetical protein
MNCQSYFLSSVIFSTPGAVVAHFAVRRLALELVDAATAGPDHETADAVGIRLPAVVLRAKRS